MKSLIEKIVFLILCFGITTTLSAQTKKEPKKTEAKQVHIDLVDGSSIEGKLIARRGDTVVVESATFGVLNLHIKNIKNIDAVSAENIKDGQLWFENIHAPHGYLAPTGFNFRKGEGYYGNVFLILNQVGYGFTDHFSISGGTELASLFFNDGGSSRGPNFFYLNPKFSYQVDKSVTLGAGAMLLIIREGGDFQTVPAPYGIATLGNRNTNLSVGLGAPIVSGVSRTTPLFMLSGQARIARRVSLMSENFFVNEQGVGASGFGITGFRFMSKSFAFNIGLMYALSNDGASFFDLDGGNNSAFAPVPFLGLSVPFGKVKK